MDNEKLVDAVTRIIMERLAGEEPCPPVSVVTFGDVPGCVLGEGLNVRAGTSSSDTDGADYIVVTQAAFRAFHGGAIPAGLTGVVGAMSAPDECCCEGGTTDFSGKKVVSERDVRELNLVSGAVVKVAPHAIVTALARDYILSHGATIQH